MGEVWAAAQTQAEFGFEKLIALKVLLSKDKSENATLMFFDEAKAAAALSHAAIVQTVDLGRDREILYIAMDMVHGPSLTALLQRLVINKRKMKPSIVAHIGIQMASALDYAHTRATHEGKQLKLVHRDVSPHNVLLDLNGSVRLTDFGVARTAIQDHKSRVGTVRGKPSYMAPEQVVGGDIDSRTDLFALGIVLYESSCLKRLFGRSNPVKSMDAVLKHDPKPLLDLVPDFPPALWEVIKKALHKDPNQRHQSAAAMVEALNEASRSLEDVASTTPDLVDLINKNFDPDSFDVDGRVQEAMAGPEDGVATAAHIEVRGVGTMERVSEVIGTQMAWPSAHAPDPLAPEAIEEARTQFRAVTPSHSASVNMYAPSMEITPHQTGSSVLGYAPAPKRNLVPIVLLCVAAFVLLGTAAFVVLGPDDGSNVVDVQEDGRDLIATPGVKRKAGAVQKEPEKPPVSKVVSPPPRNPPTELTRRQPRKSRSRAPKNAAPPPPPRDTAPARQATFRDVKNALDRLGEIDPDAKKRLFPQLLEGGRKPEKLTELHRQVKKAMKKAQARANLE